MAARVPIVTLDGVSDLIERATLWADSDPDPETRADVEALVGAADLERLHELFDAELTFGTAGLRGEVGPGPNRMNRAVVIRTTRGLADHLLAREGASPDRPVVVGFDARPTSRRFAEDAAGVLAAAGLAVIYFGDPTPTPLVAFAAKHLRAQAAVVITASHNPPSDSGYKVYGANAAQIVPPDDNLISAAIAGVKPAREVSRIEDPFSGSEPLVAPAPSTILDCYQEEVLAARPSPVASTLKIVYTPLHGVGGAVLEAVFRRAGHDGVVRVDPQFEPDGRFPTVEFPNPEEPGALDLAVARASDVAADLIIANDPDADRLAVAVPDGAGEWRPLSGNEVGALLGDYILRHVESDERPIVVSSIVSSPMLARVAAAYGARHEVTLTGFKWIINAGLALERAGEGRFVFGYEEALGYTVGPAVRDKDGIAAALLFTDLVAGLHAEGTTVLERLVELWEVSGLWVSAQHSVVRPGPDGEASIRDAVSALVANPPTSIGGHAVSDITDYRLGAEGRPPWLGRQDLVELSLGHSGRALARPSGTEPKLKIYVDLRGECGDDAFASHDRLLRAATEMAAEIASGLGF